MIVHLVLCLIMGLIVVAMPVKLVVPGIRGSLDKEDVPPPDVVRLKQEIVPRIHLVNRMPGGTFPGLRPADTDSTALAGAAPKLKPNVVPVSNDVQINVGIVSPYSQSSQTIVRHNPNGTYGDPGQYVSDYRDAMDRITQEILNKLARSKVLVVWVMDQSESMQDDRDEITARIKNVYEELQLSNAATGDALQTAVISYGAKTALHTPQPTSKPDEIIAAMNAIPVDPSGQEMQCAAVSYAASTFQNWANRTRRQTMVVLVTDESGDAKSNYEQLETTIDTAKANAVPIYVLGREAVFGYPFAHMRWTDAETKLSVWLRIDRGPETPDPEQLQVDGLHRRYDAHPSGFGPYEQSRMARETGGVFFLLPSPEANLHRRDERVYDFDAMRPYLPELSARADYRAERDKHPLRATLWKVITDLNPYDPKLENLVQVQVHGWPIDRTEFAKRAELNIAKAQRLIEYFAAAEQALEQVAPLRQREPSVRWRADYDLTRAQLVAYQARLYDYIEYVRAFTVQPKPIKNELGPARPTNRWSARTVKRTLADDERVAALRDRSLELLRKVVKEHAGTPWASRAEYEIGRGFGIELFEDHDDPRSYGIVRRVTL